MSKDKGEFNYHPIQLREVKVLNLSISTNSSCIDGTTDKADYSDFGFFHTHSEYDSENRMFAVKIAAKIGGDSEDEVSCPFNMDVELLGLFDVDEDRFPIQYIEEFAEKNAPLLVYPFLREHVYSLTSRAGFDTAVLPLFEIPVFRLEK